MFWSRINTLRVIWQEHERAVVASSRSDAPDERTLEPTVASQLKDLIYTINIFVVGDRRLMELDAIRPGPQDSEAAKQEMSMLRVALDDAVTDSEIASEPAREALTEQIENVEVSPHTLAGRQANEFGRRSVRNFVSELLRLAYAPIRNLSQITRAEGGAAWKFIREGAYRSVGATLITGVATDIAGVTNFSGAIIDFVVRHANELTAYVVKTFQNPGLVDIINWIIRLGS